MEIPAEERLLQAQETERIVQILETALDAVVTMNAQGLIAGWNAEAERMFGWRRDEVIGRRLGDTIIPAPYREAHQRGLRKFLDCGEGPILNQRIEVSALHRDGHELEVELTVTSLKHQDGWTFGAFIRDISERKHADETRAFLASIVESSDDSIVGTALDGTIVSWNRGAERLFGYTADDAIGAHINILFPPDVLFPADRKQDPAQSIERIKQNERIERFEAVRAKKDGTLLNVSIILSPIKDSRGKLLGVSAIYRDMTQLMLAEAELRRAKEAAEAASLIKSEFLANMSHEIRTPMNGILGMTEVLLDTELSAEQRDYLSTVQTSAESLLTIINNILDLSKIEAHKLDLEHKEFTLRACIDATVQALSVQARAKNLNLVWAVASGIPDVVVGDEGRLRQILLNLVGNAIKFTDAGSVGVSVETSPENSSLLRFMIRDTGSGIPLDKQNLIFDAFTQGDNSSTRKHGGTGLGLTIVSRLVQMMGGRIWVESDGRTGSVFYFTAQLEAVWHAV